jgi:CheY-like chemotaxis protein
LSARILAVEDTPALRALLELSLTRAGYRVDLAEEGRSAVELFLAAAYDAVVMDVQMPVMDGLTAVMRMRESEKERGRAAIPMLALTANTEPADLRKCLEAGFTATVRKPFGREELLSAVAKHLGGGGPAAPILVAADPEFAQLIPHFLDNCRLEAAAIRKALEARDYRAIVEASHKLTGAGATYGFQPVSDEGRLIEAAAKAADGAKILVHLDEMCGYLARVSVVYR